MNLTELRQEIKQIAAKPNFNYLEVAKTISNYEKQDKRSRKALKKTLKAVSDDAVIDAACEVFNVAREDLYIQFRGQPIPTVRFFIWKFMYDFKDYTYEKAANILGRKHCTSLHGVKKITGFLEINDKETVDNWNKFINLLR